MPAAPTAPAAAKTAPPAPTSATVEVPVKGRQMPSLTTPALTESFNELRKIAGAEPRPLPKPADKKATPPDKTNPAATPEPEKADDKPVAEPEKTGDEKPTGEQPKADAAAEAAPPESKGLGKVLSFYKKRSAGLENEITTLKKQLETFQKDQNVVSGMRAELEAKDKKLKELQDTLYSFDYTQDPDFRKTYVEPYTAAYRRALKTITELNVQDDDGNVRKASESDLIPILQLPLGQALELAQKTFGEELGRYVITSHYNEVRRLADAQLDAMEEAKKTGSERARKQTEAQQRLTTENLESWQKFSAQDEQAYEWLRVKEGDDEWNAALAKGTKIVDEALSSNPNDPNLSSVERQAVIQKRVAMRNRARGFSIMRLENNRLKAEVAKLQKTIDGYKNVQPGAAEGAGERGGSTGTEGTMQASLADLRSRAK